MDKSHIDTLIQEALDGVLSPHDAGLLQAELDSNPDAKRAMDEFRSIANVVARTPQAPVPDGFANRVMAALPKPVYAPARPVRMRLPSFFARPQFRLAYAAVAGALVATVATLAIVGPSQTGTLGAAGTMGAAGSTQIATDVASAEVSLRAHDDGVQLILLMDGPMDVAVRYSGDRSQPVSVEIRDALGTASSADLRPPR